MAIACQGGGSHTAFTAGVLMRLLREEPLYRGHEIVGLSGTSGGAVCAFLAWHGLLERDRERAAELLAEFWLDNSVTGAQERLVNSWILWASALQNVVAMPAVSPYDNSLAELGVEEFRRMLHRRVDFDQLTVRPDPADPLLLIGAVDVLSGEFKAFNSRNERITADAILASATIPTLFRSLHMNGATYWDGLFSQNPPVRELVDSRPDEIWVIQINPTRRETEPKSVLEIADRRNELSGNLSLHQELHFIEKVNQLLEREVLASGGKYKRIVIRVIELARSRLSLKLGTASKLNRDPTFIRELIAHGDVRAEEFLTALAFEDAWRRHDADTVLDFFAEDAELDATAPFPELGPYQGRAAIRRFVTDQLAPGVDIDTTRTQVARNRITWTVRGPGADPATRVEGPAAAEFRDGHIAAFHLGAAV